jgi:6,7-dimethyl-8-ribityllumazine synthase
MAQQTNQNLLNTAGILKKNACVVLIKTEWNASIVDQLEMGCIAMLEKSGVKKIISLTVPGAVEIPFGIKKYWDSVKNTAKPDAFIALGCVIRGETPHFEYISSVVSNGILQLNLSLPVPTIFGVLTVENERQAMDRVGGKEGNKGEDAAATAIKMIAYSRHLKK